MVEKSLTLWCVYRVLGLHTTRLTARPLRIHPQNPRYLADDMGKAIWLAGSHTWANFQERGVGGETDTLANQRITILKRDIA